MTKAKQTKISSDSPRVRKIELKPGSLEGELSWVLNKPKSALKTTNKVDELKEISKFAWLDAPLTTREKLIAGAMGYEGFEQPDWLRLFVLTTKKPKLNLEVVKTIFDKAISTNNSEHLLFFGCIGPKTSQQVIAHVLLGKVEWTQIKNIIDSLHSDKVNKLDQKKLQNSLNFLSYLVKDGDKIKLIASLVSLAASVEESQFVLIAKAQKKQILKSTIEIFLNKDFNGDFSNFLKSRTCSDEIIRKIINNLTFYGIDEGLLSALIFELVSAGRLNAVKQVSVVKKFSINLIASIAATNEILEFFLDEKDSYINQFSTLLRHGGVGAVMQIADQNKNFDLIVQKERDLLVDYVSSKKPRSSILIDLLVREQITLLERDFVKTVEKRNAETISEKNLALANLKKSEELVEDLKAKIVSLEAQLRSGKKDQKLDHNKVIQQAQLQVLIEFVKFVEDLRVLIVGFHQDDANLRSVFENAVSRLKELKVFMLGEVGAEPLDLGNYFNASTGSDLKKFVVGSPSYIFRMGEQEVVLVRGELKSK